MKTNTNASAHGNFSLSTRGVNSEGVEGVGGVTPSNIKGSNLLGNCISLQGSDDIRESCHTKVPVHILT